VFSLAGKKALVVGIANEDSIAFGCAKAFRAQGADLAVTFQNDKAEPFVRPLAEKLDTDIVLPLDVREDAQFEHAFDEIRRQWGGIDLVLHSIAFCPREDLHGRVTDCTRGGFTAAMDISVHSFIRLVHLADPLMPVGGACMTVSFLGADKVVEHYNIMGPVKAALEAATRYMAAELSFHAVYGTPWMMRVAGARSTPPPAQDVSKLPHVQDAIKRAKLGGYAEGIVRMLVLLARARGAVRRDRLERSHRLLHAHPPFNSMTGETRTRLIFEQTVIVEYCGDEAIALLAELLKDPVDRYRALNLVLDVAGPLDQMDDATVAMFRRFQVVLLTLAREWRDPDLGRHAPAAADELQSRTAASADSPPIDVAADSVPAGQPAAERPEESAA